jgi:hypothetical protein
MRTLLIGAKERFTGIGFARDVGLSQINLDMSVAEYTRAVGGHAPEDIGCR